MNWNWLEIVVMALASSQVVETYRHGSLFQKLRQSAANASERGHLVAKLLSCPFCFSHYPPLFFALWCGIANRSDWARWQEHMWLVPVWLAVIRVSQLINDLSHERCRSPYRGEDSILDERQ